MRHFPRLLANRYGVALGLIVIIAVIVGVGKALGAAALTLPTGSATGAAVSTASAEPDDGQDSPDAPLAPSTSPGAAVPQSVAVSFATAWLHHDGVSGQAWFSAVSRYSTESLKNELTGVDPAGVPASQITGPPSDIPHDASFVEIAMLVDSGTLTLRLLASHGRWLVDG